LAIESDASGCGLVNASDQVECRGLSGAVGSDEAEHVTVANAQVQFGDGGKTTEADRNFVELKQFGHQRFISLRLSFFRK
jgi:hypothetical protein